MKKQNQMKGQPLPAQIDGHNLVCLTTKIPDDPYYIAAVHGIFKKLEHYSWWEKSGLPGDIRAAQAAQYWRTINNQYLTVQECLPAMPVEPIPAGLAVGMVIPYAGRLPLPDGLLMCDGAVYLGTDYPELFSVINTAYIGGASFNVPDLNGRTVVGYGNPPTAFQYANQFNLAWGIENAQLAISHMPSHHHQTPELAHGQSPHTHIQDPHRHQVFKDDGTPVFGVQLPASSNNPVADNAVWSEYTVAVNQPANANIANHAAQQTTDIGGDQAHLNMQPSRVLYYVIVAKTITGGMPRETVMASTTSPDGQCKSIYWRYADEEPAANRFLLTVCNGETGGQGETGAPGVCPDCEDQVPAPEGEQPQRCKVATGIVDFLVRKYEELLQGYLEQVVNQGIDLIEFGEWARTIVFYNGNPVTAVTNLMAWINAIQAQDIADNLTCAQDPDFKDELICWLYCLLPLNGDFTSEVYSEWRTTILSSSSATCKDDFLSFMEAITLQDMRVEALAAIQFGIVSDCAGCGCNCIDEGELLALLGCGTPLEFEPNEDSVDGATYRIRFFGTYTRDSAPGVEIDWFYRDDAQTTPLTTWSQITENVPSQTIPPYSASREYIFYAKGNGLRWLFKRFPRYADCHSAVEVEVLCWSES